MMNFNYCCVLLRETYCTRTEKAQAKKGILIMYSHKFWITFRRPPTLPPQKKQKKPNRIS